MKVIVKSNSSPICTDESKQCRLIMITILMKALNIINFHFERDYWFPLEKIIGNSKIECHNFSIVIKKVKMQSSLFNILKYVLFGLNSVVPHLCIAPRRNTKTQRSRDGTTSKNKAYMHKTTYARTYILRREYQHCKSCSSSSYFLACTYILLLRLLRHPK